MSYDFQVWSVKPLTADAFPKPEMWQGKSPAWTHSRKNWQIVVFPSDHVEPEDIPEEIRKLLPGIEWLTNLNLEGRFTSEALRLAHFAAVGIAKASYGAVFDPQERSIRLPSGIKRLMPRRGKETFDVVRMSWWFLDSPVESSVGREQLISLFEQLLPEVLPKRYGTHEPPQHVYATTGKEHFLTFLNENLHRVVVWYPHRPVVSVSFHLAQPVGAHKLGFRTNHLAIAVEKIALTQPGWSTNLKRLWEQTSALVRPIYGDVRILGNYKWMGATVSRGQQHPTKSWWWRGIPEKLGEAAVLGTVYQRLWPAFAAKSKMADGLAFASLDDWTIDGDLSHKVGEPPRDQLQILGRFGGYPQGWPFGKPFAAHNG